MIQTMSSPTIPPSSSKRRIPNRPSSSSGVVITSRRETMSQDWIDDENDEKRGRGDVSDEKRSSIHDDKNDDRKNDNHTSTTAKSTRKSSNSRRRKIDIDDHQIPTDSPLVHDNGKKQPSSQQQQQTDEVPLQSVFKSSPKIVEVIADTGRNPTKSDKRTSTKSQQQQQQQILNHPSSDVFRPSSTSSVSILPEEKGLRPSRTSFMEVFSGCGQGMLCLAGVPEEIERAFRPNGSKVSNGIMLCADLGLSLDSSSVAAPPTSRGFRDDESNEQDYYDTVLDLDEQQIRRLSSWGTYGTVGTEMTGMSNDSSAFLTNASDHSRGGDTLSYYQDDDGNPIDPKLMERTRKKQKKRLEQLQKMNRRRRLVKFAYPPITSLKQCPRVDPEELPKLFYSEEELDMYEDDRRSTYTVDDVEIVAISTSLSDDADPVLNRTATTANHHQASPPDPTSIPKNDSNSSSIKSQSKRQQLSSSGSVSKSTSRTDPPPPSTVESTPTRRGSSNSSNRDKSAGVAFSPSKEQPDKPSRISSFLSSPKSKKTNATSPSSVSNAMRRRPGTPTPAAFLSGVGRRTSIESTKTLTANNHSNIVDLSSQELRSLNSSSSFAIAKSTSNNALNAPPTVSATPSGLSSSAVVTPPISPNPSFTSSASKTTTTTKNKRLLKSVQIYLRERSTGL